MALAALWYDYHELITISESGYLVKIGVSACNWEPMPRGTTHFAVIHMEYLLMGVKRLDPVHPTCPECLVLLDQYLADPWPRRRYEVPEYDLNYFKALAKTLEEG